jgi:cytosine/adenosine deaminase-related metal-dependent hydrolase
MRRLPALASVVLVAACGGTAAHTGSDAGRDGEGGPMPAPDAATDAGPDAPPGGPLCTVAAKGTSGVVLTGRLLLPTGATTGELFIGASGIIACAAASCSSTQGYASATRIACPGGVISPGLINAHDHTEYATAPPVNHGTIRYEHRNDWRTGAEGATPLSYSSTGSSAVIAAQELRLVLGGGTSIVGTSGVEGLARNLAAYTDTKELGGLSGQTVYFDIFPLGDESGTLITSGCAYPSIRAASSAFSNGVYAPHLAEGINLAAENELTCASLASNDLVTARTSIIHGVGLNAKDIAAVKTSGAKLIWSPRSNISLYGNTASLTEYRYAGITIALGTDWLPSGSMNMLRELACADGFNQKYLAGTFSDQDLWEMATVNAAAAAGFDSQIGSLAVGKVADVAVFDGRTHADYRAVIDAAGDDVHLVLRGGAALYGDADLVAALATGCGAIEVCGMARSVCLDVPAITLSDVTSAAASIYPLFTCRGQTPPGEPTCVPYRDTYPAGTSATDRDGDGIADKMDDCPTIFNPVRPMDGTKQSDLDGDGFGDACDAKPLDPSAH